MDNRTKYLANFDTDTMSVNALNHEIKQAIDLRNEMVNAAEVVFEDADGEMGAKQKQTFDRVMRNVEKLDKKIAKAEAQEQRDAKRAVPYHTPENGVSRDPDVQIWESVAGKNKGEEIKVLSNKASLQNVLGTDSGGMNWRDYMRGRIAGFSGDHSLEGAQNVMSTTSDTSLVPEPLSAEIIDLARSKARTFQAGAQTVPMSSKTLTIARITGDASNIAWKAENASHSAGDVTTEPLTFTAKTLIASVKLSVELSEDSPNASQIIEDSLSNGLALELDRVGLVGSGAGAEPQGIYGAANVQSVDKGTNGGTLTDYNDFSNAYQKVLEANGDPNAAIFAPRTWGTLDRLVDSTGQPLQPPMSFKELMALQTTQVPIDQTKGTATNASSAFVADFAQLLYGVRTDLRIEVTRVASDGSGNSAWENLQVWVRAYLRADVQLAHPNHFAVIDGIIPA